jgi:hypothetical protein
MQVSLEVDTDWKKAKCKTKTQGPSSPVLHFRVRRWAVKKDTTPHTQHHKIKRTLLAEKKPQTQNNFNFD